MINKLSKIISIFFLKNIEICSFIFSLRMFPEFLLDEIADILFFEGQKFYASRAWSILKSRELKRLQSAKYYVISNKGIYAYGEFLSRIDGVLKSMECNLIKKLPLRIYLQTEHVPNKLFLEMLSSKVTVFNIEKKINYAYFKYILDKKYLMRPTLLKINDKIFHNSEFFPHLLKLSGNQNWVIPCEYKKKFNKYLSKIIPFEYIINKKIIVLHIPEKKGIHIYRNVNNPDNYIDTINYLTNLGFYVIRIGRISKPPLVNLNSKYIDLSIINDKPDGIDAYLISIATFNILGSSGPNWIYYLFNSPAVLTNTFPIHHTGLLSQDIFLIKKIIFNGKKINLKEMLNLGFDSPHVINNIDCICLDNTSEEILGAVKEMINKLFNNKSKISDYQLTYNNIIESHLSLKCGGKISKNFIMNNLYLIS
jgi:putative glycosyltransferase (TIGR04372 family)